MWATCCHDSLTALPYGKLLWRPTPTKQQPQKAGKYQGDSLAQYRHHRCAGISRSVYKGNPHGHSLLSV